MWRPLFTSVEAGPYEIESVYQEMIAKALASIPDDVGVTSQIEHGHPAARITEAAAGTTSS